MEQRQLNFAEKSVQVLTLEELEKSYHENLTTGEPVGGIYHFALIQQVLEIFLRSPGLASWRLSSVRRQ